MPSFHLPNPPKLSVSAAPNSAIKQESAQKKFKMRIQSANSKELADCPGFARKGTSAQIE